MDTFAPFGLRPLRKRGGVPNNAAQNRYRINPGGLALTICRGDPVLTNAGYITRVTAATDFVKGIFWGCHYVDPTTKRPTYSPFYTANTSTTAAGTGTITAFVIDDPDITFVVQADASVSVGDLNFLNFEATISAGDTTTGQSRYALDASTRVATTALMRPVDIYEIPGNVLSDAFPILECEWVQHADFRVSAQ